MPQKDQEASTPSEGDETYRAEAVVAVAAAAGVVRLAGGTEGQRSGSALQQDADHAGCLAGYDHKSLLGDSHHHAASSRCHHQPLARFYRAVVLMTFGEQ